MRTKSSASAGDLVKEAAQKAAAVQCVGHVFGAEAAQTAATAQCVGHVPGADQAAKRPRQTPRTGIKLTRIIEKTRNSVHFKVGQIENGKETSLMCVSAGKFKTESQAKLFAEWGEKVANSGVRDKTLFLKAKHDVCSSGAASICEQTFKFD